MSLRRAHRWRWLLGAAGSAAILLAPPAASASAGAGTGGQTPATSKAAAPGGRTPADRRLSDEMTFTRWAYIARTGAIFSRPATTSRRVAKLHWLTADDFPEVYLLLDAHWTAPHREWVRIRIPMRPNGRTGWVPRRDLGAFHVTHKALVVDRRRLRIELFDRGRRVWSAPVGVGKRATPTPAGHFWIREAFPISDPTSGYWPYAFGTSDYSTLGNWPEGGVVGIHGPYGDDAGIPGRISHGCIRLHPADDAWLSRHIGIGTPLRVL